MAGAGGAMRATGWRATAIRFQQFGEGALMASLAERTASPWTATSMRDRPAGCSTCASSLCGAVCGNGRSPAADVDGLLVPIGWRRGFGAAPAMMVPRRRGATNTTLAATQRHPCRSGMVTADCARSRSRPETVVASGGTEGSAENSRVHHLCSPTRAREALMMAGAGGAMRATGWRATAIRFQQFGEGALMASLAERTASPWTATSMRDRPAGCSTCASSLCGAVCGNGRSPAADVDGLLVPIGWRRGFGAAPAMMVPRRRGATNTTLAATQRHPCRSGMVTADCARSRSRPETVVASGGTEGSAENSRVHHLSHPLARARR